MKAAADAAHALGVRLAVHTYGLEGARDAVRAGANTVEHAEELDDATLAEINPLALTSDGQVIAAIYGFFDKDRFWFYQSGFQPAWARFSPGSLILEFAVSEAIRHGATVFDFLRGDESYKAEWGARFEPSYRLLLWPAS